VDRCVVCSAQVNKEKAYIILKYKDEEYLVCCPLCKSKFEEDSEKYARKGKDKKD
jgi:YHS domain-containing protein